jgi:hypothetical protein
MSAPEPVDHWCEHAFAVTSALYNYMEEHPHSTKGAARRSLQNRIADLRRIERSYARMRDIYGNDDDLKEQIDMCFSQMMDAKKEFQSYMREQPKSQHGGTRRRPLIRRVRSRTQRRRV